MAVTPGVEVVAFATVAGMAALAGVIILVANPRHPWNSRLGAYLLVEAASFGAHAAAQTTDAPHHVLTRVARVLGLVGPVLLVSLAAVFPRRKAVGWLVALFLASALVALAAPEQGVAQDLDRVHVVAAYAVASVLLAAGAAREPSGIVARQAQVVTAGVLAVTLPWIAVEVARVVDPTAGAVAAAAWVVVLWSLHGALARGLGRSGRGLAVAFAALTAVWIVGHVSGEAAVAALVTLEVRWFVLAAALGYGIIRFQVLSVTPRRWGASVAASAGLAIFGTSAAVGAVVGPVVGAAIAAALAMAAVVMVRSAVTDPVATHRVEAYRSLLASRVAQDAPAGWGDVQDAARRLGVTRREHDLLMAAVEAEEAAAERGPARGRYAVVERLAAGGQAVVELAHDTVDDRPVVLKRYHDAGSLRHAVAAARVAHPNLVAVHDVLALPRGGVVVMEHVDGPTLAETLDDGGPLPAERVDALARGLLAGLAALHGAGVAHGDVKPANVLLGEDGVKLADLGASGPSRGSDTLPAAGLTPAFASPERRDGAAPSPEADVFAAGLTILAALAGGEGAADVVGEAPAEWRPVLATALADAPENRWPHAGAMLAAWEAASS